MKDYDCRYDPMPSGLAYFDGTRYHCTNFRCYFERETLTECGRLPSNGTIYTPILRCSGCGRYYYGNDTPKDSQHQAPILQPATHEEEPSNDIILPNLITV